MKLNSFTIVDVQLEINKMPNNGSHVYRALIHPVAGVSVSALSRSIVLVNPDLPEAKKLRSWYVTVHRAVFFASASYFILYIFSDFNIYLFLCRYDSEGKGASLASVSTGMSPSIKSGARSMYSDRVSLSYVTENPSLGEDKVLHYQLLKDVKLNKAMKMVI